MLALKRTRIEVKISKNNFVIIRILPTLIWLSEKKCRIVNSEFWVRDYESCEFLFPIYYVTIVIIEKVKNNV